MRHVEDAPRPAPDAATTFLLRFARAGHDAGYSTAELEDRLQALARSLGHEEAQISATPTLVDVSLGSIPRQQTYSLRVRPTTVDLDAIARLDHLVQEVVDRPLAAESALAALADVEAERLDRPWPMLLAAYALAGVALTVVLGGGWRDAAGAGAIGFVVGAIALPASRTARTEPIVAPAVAVAASFSAATLVELGLDASPDVVTLAALVTFLPGMTLTIGMRELATEHLQSGVANTASALVQLLGLVFGVGVGRSIASSWFGTTSGTFPNTSFDAVHLLAAVAAGLAFTVTLRAQRRDALIMCAATVTALGANEIGGALFGKQAAALVAAFTVGIAGGLAGWLLRRSSLVFIVPAVLMLVPGSTGFSSVLQLLTNQTVSGITAGFDTFVTAISIAYGLMISTIVLPRRFTQILPAQGTARSGPQLNSTGEG
jgi:uncharacterized membrane protein YjjP (DUF1212 family)